MKYLYRLVICISLFHNPLYGQNVDVERVEILAQDDWEKTIDYVNAEVTFLCLVQYKNPTASEIRTAKNLENNLAKNKIENPITFACLNDLIKVDWGTTIKKISKPIDLIKQKNPRNLDTLFSFVEKQTKTIFPNGGDLKIIKDNVIEFYELRNETEKEVIEPIKEPINQIVPERLEKSSNYNIFLLAPAILFLILSILLFFKNRKLSNEINQLRAQRMNQSNNNYTEKDKELYNLKEKLKMSDNQIENLHFENKKLKANSPPIQSISIDTINEEKSPEVNFEISNIPLPAKIVYAGKPTTDNKFSNISSQPIENQTIFKLTIDSDEEHANFEVILVSDFMIRNITNSPDDYLYRVCNQENSNKDFSREIITTKYGVALLIDGDWVVKEENKATIKFQ